MDQHPYTCTALFLCPETQTTPQSFESQPSRLAQVLQKIKQKRSQKKEGSQNAMEPALHELNTQHQQEHESQNQGVEVREHGRAPEAHMRAHEERKSACCLQDPLGQAGHTKELRGHWLGLP